MDDYKRALLMHVRDELVNSKEPRSICFSFLNQLEIESYPNCVGGLEFIEDMFPEMDVLFDHKIWLKNGYGTNYTYNNGTDYWWSCGWIEPRIAMIDFLLNNR